jgi:hypothetical protein
MEHEHSRRYPLCETTKIHIVLRRQEDYINDNRNSIFSLVKCTLGKNLGIPKLLS